jgi:hypothetical protein
MVADRSELPPKGAVAIWQSSRAKSRKGVPEPSRTMRLKGLHAPCKVGTGGPSNREVTIHFRIARHCDRSRSRERLALGRRGSNCSGLHHDRL